MAQKNVANLTSIAVSPQIQQIKNIPIRISENANSLANSYSTTSFPFQIQAKQQKYNIYDNQSIGTIDQLSRKNDNQRNSSSYSTYSRRGQFDLKNDLEKKVYQQSEDPNLTTKDLLKNDTVSLVKDVRTLTLEKNKNKNEVENNKETIDELEVIRRRYSKI